MTSHRRALGGRAGADGWLNCDGVRFALPPRLRPDHDLYQHNPVRTPLTDPYSFDPHTVYGFPGPNADCNETYWSDRLEIEDYKRYAACWQQVRDQGGGDLGQNTQTVLRLFTDDAELRLLRIIRYCNAGGFSVYRYDVHSPKVAAAQKQGRRTP